MGLYKELSEKRKDGKKLDFDKLSVRDLRILFIDEGKSDRMIAELFDVKLSKVTYRRRKNEITIRDALVDDYLSGKSDHAKEWNVVAKNELLSKENISMISKAITHFAFRNGPIEDIHADPNKGLTDSDMKKLNKFMVNRLAHIFTLMIDERWIELDMLIGQIDLFYGKNWDKALPDDGGTTELLKKMLRRRT